VVVVVAVTTAAAWTETEASRVTSQGGRGHSEVQDAGAGRGGEGGKGGGAGWREQAAAARLL